MKNDLPVKKNEVLTLAIADVTAEGQGVGRVDGYAVFVPGALEGETVRALIIKCTSGYAIGKLLSVETASPDRVVPVCSAYPACGGCTLQHLAYGAQLRLKTKTVRDALARLGGFLEVPVQETIGMESPWHYRNKGSFPIGRTEHGVQFGFFAARSHRLIPLSDCPIQDARITEVARHVTEWAETFHITPYDETTHSGVLRHVMARVTTSGEVMAVVVTTGALPREAELLSALETVDSVWHNVNPDDTNVIFGPDFRLLCGEKALVETVGGQRFFVSPQSFLQVNAAQTAVLYGTAVRLLAAKPEETVVDAYSGIGTISLLLAAHAGQVIGIESVEAAVSDAHRTAVENGCANVRFLCGDVAEVLPTLAGGIDAVVTDPPRKGCDERVLRAIIDSGAGRMVYVSCNPATLARDCRILADGGFAIEAVQPIDMFPQTSHVETVVLLTRVR